MEPVQPMSPRRFLVVLVALLVAVVGAGLIALALLELQDPVMARGETGALSDATAELRTVRILGVVLLAGGAGTAVGLVRRQLRTARA